MLAQLTETDAIGLHWIWYLIGFGGQIAFGSRFFVQWLASERARRSVVPKVFWYLSLLGSLLLLTYAIRIGDAVFITGQSSGFLVYSRNLYLIRISGQDAAPPTPPRSENPTPQEQEENRAGETGTTS